MYLSRVKISNFRNFSELDVSLSEHLIIVGENRVGKSNLLFALRLIFDPTLSDNARQLGLSDFWDGLGAPDLLDKIIISVEIKDFQDDLDLLAILTDYRLDSDPDTVRLSYELRPRPDLTEPPKSDDDYEFICYGGEHEAKRFGHELRRRVTMDLLPALRDAERELASWKKSPLRPLIEKAAEGIDTDELEDIKIALENTTALLGDFDEIKDLEDNLSTLFAEMVGSKQDIHPRLGFAATDATRLLRNIRLLIDDGKRTINDASLGSANIAFLTLKTLELRHLINENRREQTLLAIEEPEAHLHPHLQRSIYRQLFEKIGDDPDNPLSVLLTTHSPHIVSVAPMKSLLLLKDEGGESIGHSTASIELSTDEEDDLARYIDVTRAEMLFARGIILIEGDAEKFLIPTFSESLGFSLDHLGITVCSVSGTNFKPYAKFLTALNIPFSVITDWDPVEGKDALGYKRSLNLVEAIEHTASGTKPTVLIDDLTRLYEEEDYALPFCKRCETHGIFSNEYTLEVDLLNTDAFEHIIATLKEHPFGKKRKALIQSWEDDPDKIDTETDKYLAMIEDIGKGRFAQRLASRISDVTPPDYIKDAIQFVVDRV